MFVSGVNGSHRNSEQNRIPISDLSVFVQTILEAVHVGFVLVSYAVTRDYALVLT